MNVQTFNVLLDRRLDKTKNVLAKKAVEYGAEDRLHNFARAAMIANSTKAQACFGMMLKHWVSVIDLVEGRLEATPEMVDEKLGDTINYLILLEAILTEARGNSTCLVCGDCSNGEPK